MILERNLLLSDPEKEEEWRLVLSRQKKKPSLYVLCMHDGHVYPAEIMTSKELFRTEKHDPRYRVFGIAEDYPSALKLLTSAVEETLTEDPSLKTLKGDFRRLAETKKTEAKP